MKKFLKILILLVVILVSAKIVIAATTPGPDATATCGDKICDDKRGENAETCPEDCSNLPNTPGAVPTSQEVNPTSSSANVGELQNEIDMSSFKSEVKNDLVIFGFKTANPAISAIKVSAKDNKSKIAAEGLSLYSTTLENPENKYTDFPKAEFKTSTYYLIKGLKPNTAYEISLVVTVAGTYYEGLTISFTTASSKDQKSQAEVSQPSVMGQDDFAKLVQSFYVNKYSSIDEIDKICNEYSLDQELCNLAKEAKGEQGIEAQSEANKQTAQIETLADKFFKNKIIFYGDIGLLALLLIIEAVYLAKSRGAWGVVFDSKDKKPLQGAIVRVFLEENNKMLETKVTDAEGRFSFLVKPGNYYLDVTKQNYRFPSKLLTKKNDEFYTDMYRGEVVHIFKGNALLNPNIPTDKIGETVETIEQTHKQLSSFGKKFNYFLIHLFRLVLLVLLTILNIGFVVIAYVPPLLIIAILVGLMWLLEGYAILRKGHY